MSQWRSAEDPIGPRAFVSYAHVDVEHKLAVLAFATLLREMGVDAVLDEWYADQRQDWLAWALREIRPADFVIVVASAGYCEAGDGTAPSGHRGVQSEATTLRDLLHGDRETWTRKVVPVVLPGGSIHELPDCRAVSAAGVRVHADERILPLHVRDFVRNLQQERVPTHAVHRCKTVLSGIFTTALHDRVIFLHPCTGVRVPTPPVRPLQVLTPDELEAILAELPDEEWRLLVESAIAPAHGGAN